MKKLFTLTSVVLLTLGLMSVQAFALDFGDQITISDNNSTTEDWHKIAEDQEVEPGMQHGQQWDLEGFFQNGEELTMIGSYNFKDGQLGTQMFYSGDIFIDVDGDAKYGDIHEGSDGYGLQDRRGYDFVLDLDFDAMSYVVYQLTDNSRTEKAFYNANQGSSPWRYYDGGIDLGISGVIGYQTELTDAETGFSGGDHNAVTVDLGFLSQVDLSGYQLAETFTVHFTMQCGNDNLMGAYNPVPEPSTVLLLGAGLLGLIGLGRKRITR